MAKSQKRITNNRLAIQYAVAHMMEELCSVTTRSASEFVFWEAIENLIESRYGEFCGTYENSKDALRSISNCYQIDIPGIRTRLL